jgi:hypothetical protein
MSDLISLDTLIVLGVFIWFMYMIAPNAFTGVLSLLFNALTGLINLLGGLLGGKQE